MQCPQAHFLNCVGRALRVFKVVTKENDPWKRRLGTSNTESQMVCPLWINGSLVFVFFFFFELDGSYSHSDADRCPRAEVESTKTRCRDAIITWFDGPTGPVALLWPIIVRSPVAVALFSWWPRSTRTVSQLNGLPSSRFVSSFNTSKWLR